MTTSPNNTTVPPAASITDAAGNVWTIGTGAHVRENGNLAGTTANVTQLAYVNGTVWQENSAGLWWSWNGTTWIPAAGTKTSPLPSTPAFSPASTIAVTLANGSTVQATFAQLQTYFLGAIA